jgi:antitoxin PrlF
MSGPGGKHESQPRFSARARVRPKAQLTLPEEIRRALHVGEGDEVEFSVHADGTITVRGYVSVPSDQAWFFTREGLAAKQQVDDDIAAGRGKLHESGDAMFAHLGSLGAAD